MEDDTAGPKRSTTSINSPHGDHPDHPLIQSVLSLRERGARDARDCLFVDGIRFVHQAADHGWSFEAVIVSRTLLKSRAGRALVRRLRDAGERICEVSPETFRRIGTARRASGLAAIVHQKERRMNRVHPKQGLCWLALEDVQSPGNLGTLLRTAAAVGAAGLMAVGDRLDPWDPAVVRASMGALFSLRIARTDHRGLERWAHRKRCAVVAATAHSHRRHVDADLRGPLILFLGHERRGLSRAARRVVSQRVRIPMPGGEGRPDSLNVGVAGSVLLYEVWRQTEG